MSKKDESNPFDELEKKLQKELQRRANAEKAKKNELFANMIAGGDGKPSKSQFDEMRDFMKDPFGAKDWAKSKKYVGEKTKSPPFKLEFDLEPLTVEELAVARKDGRLVPNFGEN